MDCTLHSFSSGGGRLAVAGRVVAVLVACVLGAMGCTGELDPDEGSAASRADSAEVAAAPGDTAEAKMRVIELAAPLNTPDAQISGLTWWDDRLVVLPQYPRVPRKEAPRVYRLSHAALAAALVDTTGRQAAIEPEPVAFDVSVLHEEASGYQGCEALLFAAGHAYVAVEATGAWLGLAGMRAYLASGTVKPAPGDGAGASATTGEAAEPKIALTGVTEIPTQTRLKDMAYEALVEYRDTLYAFYEANGANVNPSAQVHLFDRDLRPIGTRPMPALEYRLTDATSADAQGRFWVVNYLYEKEADKLDPAPDSVAMEHGMGASHRRRNAAVVERLVELQITPNGIRRTATPPIWLRLASGTGRNWEGIARFGDGFLLATDTFPETLLAYVERPASQTITDD